MSTAVAKRYVKALLETLGDKELKNISEALREVGKAYENPKFKTIIASPDISKDEKNRFVLSLFENPGENLSNFINLLSENKRLDFLKEISEELDFQISLRNNRYEGKIYSNLDIGKEQIESLQKSFSNKFNAEIKLEARKTDYPGIKIQIDDLGVETSFSLERLKAQIAEHILKAI